MIKRLKIKEKIYVDDLDAYDDKIAEVCVKDTNAKTITFQFYGSRHKFIGDYLYWEAGEDKDYWNYYDGIGEIINFAKTIEEINVLQINNTNESKIIKYPFKDIKKNLINNFDLSYLLEDYSPDEYNIDIYEDEEIILEKYVDWKKVKKLYDTLDEKWFKEVYKNNILNHDNSSLEYFDATINFDNQDINLEWMRDDIKSKQEIKNYLKSKSFMTEIIFQLLKDHADFWNESFVKSQKSNNNQSISAKDLDQAVNNNNAEMEANSQTKGGQR